MPDEDDVVQVLLLDQVHDVVDVGRQVGLWRGEVGALAHAGETPWFVLIESGAGDCCERFVLRSEPGVCPTTRVKARLKAASDW